VVELSELHVAGTTKVAVPPETVYDIVADVTRVGELSPVCRAAWWDEGSGPHVGGWFTGRNEMDGREPWERHCEVVAAEPGRAFAWVTGGQADGTAEWSYRFTPAADGGTDVEESWRILRLNEFLSRLSDEQLHGLMRNTESGIEATLSNLKRVAEAGG
jgi:Polyketide cyclase / dehydrase and lipid transport